MKHSRFVLLLPFLCALAACESASTAHPGVYSDQSPICATDMKWDLDRPETNPSSACVVGNAGSEMYDRDRGQIGIPEGASIIVTELFTGLTGIR